MTKGTLDLIKELRYKDEIILKNTRLLGHEVRGSVRNVIIPEIGEPSIFLTFEENGHAKNQWFWYNPTPDELDKTEFNFIQIL